MTVKEWSHETGVPIVTINTRYRNGLSGKDLFFLQKQ
jgi:hypothetical protein